MTDTEHRRPRPPIRDRWEREGYLDPAGRFAQPSVLDASLAILLAGEPFDGPEAA